MGGFSAFMGNTGIIIALALLGIAVAVSVLFPIFHMLTNFEEAKKALVGIAGLAVLLLIGFALAGGDVPQYAVDEGISASQFRIIGALINTALIATFIVGAYLIIDVIISVVRN